jgi:uncharacterized membrane protein YkoI
MRLIPVLLAFSFAFALPAAAAAPYVSVDDVRNMALDRGVTKIKEIELDDGVWELEGWDATGHEIEMKVDARSGAIIKMKRDD